jgi:hypothetical protein
MKQKNRKIKMATAKKKKQEPELLEIVRMNNFQSNVLRTVAWLLGLGSERVFVITLRDKEF